MRNIWTLRNNLILRKTGTSGIRGLTEYTEDWDKRNTRPNGIPGLTEYGDLGIIYF